MFDRPGGGNPDELLVGIPYYPNMPVSTVKPIEFSIFSQKVHFMLSIEKMT